MSYNKSMFGILLIALGQFFLEVSTSIGKCEVKKRVESIYGMGILSSFWTLIIFMILIIWKWEFQFSFNSLPTFILRIGIELFQVYLVLKAITIADRSTNAFIRLSTIPLLLMVDLVIIGANLSLAQIAGIFIILASLIALMVNGGIKKKGIIFVALSALNAASGITLYKFNITHYNSVEAEQSLIVLSILIFLYIFARKNHERPFRLFRKPICMTQSATHGLGTVMMSFAYVFAPASVITTAKRTTEVLWSIVSGNIVFHEKHLAIKILSAILASCGLVLLTL